MRFTVVLIAVVLGVGLGRQALGQDGLEPLFWREHIFSIPFRVHRSLGDPDAPAQILLYVSDDDGRRWSQVGAAQPEMDRFTYHALQDGVYWFALETTDRRGRFLSDGSRRAQLHVVVDTVPPRLELEAQARADGPIDIRWTAEDPYLDAASLQIQTRSEADGAWDRLAVSPSSAQHAVTGQASWLPAPGSELAWVRVEIHDQAGNPSVAVRQVLVPRPIRDGREFSPSADLAGGIAGAPRSAWQSAAAAPQPARSESWPPSAISRVPFRVANVPAGPSSLQAMPVAGGRQDGLPAGRAGGQPQRPHWINTSHVELKYDVVAVGPSGVGKVQVWGTRDGGQTWASYGVDDDRQSPVRVPLPQDGIVGLRIVVESASGEGGRPPRRGDLPEVWVGIDRTRPWARIASSELRDDVGGRRLVIRWEAQDDHLAPRPISLFMSQYAGGPWMPIASGLENTGLYVWRLQGNVPAQVYLRLDVSDEADNAFSFETPGPVALSGARPTGAIRGVRPAGPSAQRILEYHRY